MICRTILLMTAAFLFVSVKAPAQEPIREAAPPLNKIMQLKLEYSKLILEGLALEDYNKITKNSQALSLLSLESGWKILQTEEYLRQSQEFRRAANAITEASRESNLDRAALGYVGLTIRCVECHSYLRKKHPGLATVTWPKDPAKKDSAPKELAPKSKAIKPVP